MRPAFVPGRRAIQDTQAYATQTVRYRRLQLSPIVVVVVDLGAARLKKNPEERGRRMTQKVREIAAFLETQGANSLVFNDIPAPGPADILEQRAKEATERADLIVCLVRGASDAADLQRFLDGQANVAVWYPDRFDLDLPEGVRVASYSPTELQDCGLALDVQDYLDAVIDDHVLKQRG